MKYPRGQGKIKISFRKRKRGRHERYMTSYGQVIRNQHFLLPSGTEEDFSDFYPRFSSSFRRTIRETGRGTKVTTLPLKDGVIYNTVATTKRMAMRTETQLKKGKNQAVEGGLTFEMESYLRKHGIPIEVVPQKWKRIEAF